jgi:hypothetical protein
MDLRSRKQRVPGLLLLATDWSSRNKPSLAVSIKAPCNEHGIQNSESIPVEKLASDVSMFIDSAVIDQSRFWGVSVSKTWKPEIISHIDRKFLSRYAVFKIPLPEGVDARAFYKTVWTSVQDAGTRFNIMTLASHED